jgi:hypothetical protein
MLGMCGVKDSYGIRKLDSEVFDPLVASRLQLSYEHAPVEEISVSHELETYPLNLSNRTAASGKKLLRAQEPAN